MNEILKFLRISSIYFVGNVLIKVIGIIMLPIYTMYISPSDFGQYDVATTYIAFIGSVLFFDIWSGMLRFMYDYKTDDGKRDVIFTSWCIFFLSSGIYTITFFVCYYFFNIEYLFLVYLLGITTNLQTMYSFIARGMEKNLLYMLGGLAGAIMVAVCNYVFLAIFSLDYSSLYISSVLGNSVVILIIKYTFCCKFKWNVKQHIFNNGLFKNMLVYSLPLCANSVAFWVLNSYNRIFISNNLSFYENGIYAVSMKFVVALSLGTECIRLAWQELSYLHEGQDKNNDLEYYSKAINLMAKCLYLAALLLIPVIYFIFPYFVDSQYNAAKSLIPMGILAGSASAMSVFLGNIFGAIKRTQYLFVTLVISSIVNIIALYALLPIYGVACINMALFLGFFVNCFLRIIMLKKYIIIKYNLFLLTIFLIIYGKLYVF